MPPIGETLREARLRRKVEIAEVETATKIRAKYLRALENEEFERLPGSTYARTFLRTYAEYLGLDPHLLVEEYRVRHEPVPDDDPQPLAPPPPPRRRRAEAGRPQPARRRLPTVGSPGPGTIVAAVVVGVLALFLVIGLVSGGGDDDEPSVEGPAVTDESKRGDGGKKQRDEPKPERSAEPKRVELQISPVDATYVCIDNGSGARVFEGTLVEPRTFRARSLRLNLGRPSARVEVNGERVKIAGGTTPVGFEFTPDGEEELPVGERPCA